MYLWLQVCRVSPLMETKSISFSNLQVEPKHILAVAPGCRCCPPSLQFLQQLCLCRDSRDVLALTWDVWVLHSVSPVLLTWSLVIPQPCWVCAISSSRLQMPSLHWVFSPHCTGPMKMLQSNSSWGLSSTSSLRDLHTVAVRGFFCLFFHSNSFADVFLWTCLPWHKKGFGWTGPGESEPTPSPHWAAGDSSWEQLCCAGLS